jgi:hypothetical protein
MERLPFLSRLIRCGIDYAALSPRAEKGNQVVATLAIVFCLADPLALAFVKYWLFAP